VLETDVHFPTDLNLLWDAGRKCVDLIVKSLSSACRVSTLLEHAANQASASNIGCERFQVGAAFSAHFL
jgi:hypothetical protein